jgi:hypothetical protein
MNTSLSSSSIVTGRNWGRGISRAGGASPVVVEAMEGRVLMSGDLAAPAVVEPQALLLPAVQAVREAAARRSLVDGTSNTIFFGEVAAK